jgi:hypothetical protein
MSWSILYLSHENVKSRGSEVGTFAAEIRARDDAERFLVWLEVDLVGNKVDAVHLDGDNKKMDWVLNMRQNLVRATGL